MIRAALLVTDTRFTPAYGDTPCYGMDVELKFDDVATSGSPATCYIEQARPIRTRFRDYSSVTENV